MTTTNSTLKDRFPKQYNVGPWLGASKDLLARALFYMTPINLFMLTATTYHVTAKAYISQFAPWINFWMFFGALVFIAICAMVVEFKVVFPSSVSFSNIQNYKHGNLIRQDLERAMKKISEINEKLDRIEAKYNTNTHE